MAKTTAELINEALTEPQVEKTTADLINESLATAQPVSIVTAPTEFGQVDTASLIKQALTATATVAEPEVIIPQKFYNDEDLPQTLGDNIDFNTITLEDLEAQKKQFEQLAMEPLLDPQEDAEARFDFEDQKNSILAKINDRQQELLRAIKPPPHPDNAVQYWVNYFTDEKNESELNRALLLAEDTPFSIAERFINSPLFFGAGKPTEAFAKPDTFPGAEDPTTPLEEVIPEQQIDFKNEAIIAAAIVEQKEFFGEDFVIPLLGEEDFSGMQIPQRVQSALTYIAEHKAEVHPWWRGGTQDLIASGKSLFNDAVEITLIASVGGAYTLTPVGMMGEGFIYEVLNGREEGESYSDMFRRARNSATIALFLEPAIAKGLGEVAGKLGRTRVTKKTVQESLAKKFGDSDLIFPNLAKRRLGAVTRRADIEPGFTGDFLGFTEATTQPRKLGADIAEAAVARTSQAETRQTTGFGSIRKQLTDILEASVSKPVRSKKLLSLISDINNDPKVLTLRDKLKRLVASTALPNEVAATLRVALKSRDEYWTKLLKQPVSSVLDIDTGELRLLERIRKTPDVGRTVPGEPGFSLQAVRSQKRLVDSNLGVKEFHEPAALTDFLLHHSGSDLPETFGRETLTGGVALGPPQASLNRSILTDDIGHFLLPIPRKPKQTALQTLQRLWVKAIAEPYELSRDFGFTGARVAMRKHSEGRELIKFYEAHNYLAVSEFGNMWGPISKFERDIGRKRSKQINWNNVRSFIKGDIEVVTPDENAVSLMLRRSFARASTMLKGNKNFVDIENYFPDVYKQGVLDQLVNKSGKAWDEFVTHLEHPKRHGLRGREFADEQVRILKGTQRTVLPKHTHIDYELKIPSKPASILIQPKEAAKEYFAAIADAAGWAIELEPGKGAGLGWGPVLKKVDDLLTQLANKPRFALFGKTRVTNYAPQAERMAQAMQRLTGSGGVNRGAEAQFESATRWFRRWTLIGGLGRANLENVGQPLATTLNKFGGRALLHGYTQLVREKLGALPGFKGLRKKGEMESFWAQGNIIKDSLQSYHDLDSLSNKEAKYANAILNLQIGITEGWNHIVSANAAKYWGKRMAKLYSLDTKQFNAVSKTMRSIWHTFEYENKTQIAENLTKNFGATLEELNDLAQGVYRKSLEHKIVAGGLKGDHFVNLNAMDIPGWMLEHKIVAQLWRFRVAMFQRVMGLMKQTVPHPTRDLVTGNLDWKNWKASGGAAPFLKWVLGAGVASDTALRARMWMQGRSIEDLDFRSRVEQGMWNMVTLGIPGTLIQGAIRDDDLPFAPALGILQDMIKGGLGIGEYDGLSFGQKAELFAQQQPSFQVMQNWVEAKDFKSARARTNDMIRSFFAETKTKDAIEGARFIKSSARISFNDARDSFTNPVSPEAGIGHFIEGLLSVIDDNPVTPFTALWDKAEAALSADDIISRRIGANTEFVIDGRPVNAVEHFLSGKWRTTLGFRPQVLSGGQQQVISDYRAMNDTVNIVSGIVTAQIGSRLFSALEDHGVDPTLPVTKEQINKALSTIGTWEDLEKEIEIEEEGYRKLFGPLYDQVSKDLSKSVKKVTGESLE